MTYTTKANKSKANFVLLAYLSFQTWVYPKSAQYPEDPQYY